jgi:hypothetical protein
MKKHLLLIALALTASAMQAQNNEMYSLMFHDMGQTMDWDGFGIESAAQQRDGDIIVATYIARNSGSFSQPPILLGNIFYKMSPNSLNITDSLYVADSLAPDHFYSQDPRGEGNICVNIEYVEEVDSTYLRICHFPDNDLHINHEEDVVTPVCEGNASGRVSIVDCKGDIILNYYKSIGVTHYDAYAAKFNSDGALACQALLHENEGPYGAGSLLVFKESPLQYYQWGLVEPNSGPGSGNLCVYVTDSIFNSNAIILNKILREESLSNWDVAYEWLNFNKINTEVIPIGGDEILVAAQYVSDTNFQSATAEYGVAVAKYDLRTMQLKKYIVFNDFPGSNKKATCMGLKKLSDGTVYLLYKEQGYPTESIVVVKMDTDLNVDWKRFYKTDNIDISQFECSILDKDEQGEEQGIAWVGYGRDTESNSTGLVYFFLNHDGPVNVISGSGMEVRPYAFYPNPAKNQLHMEFSPDVQPVQVELYDLQGRQVRTQNKAFESIELGQLPSGTYTMRITFEDGKVYSDKVVKE